MNISRPFITRPIATTLLAVALLLGGILGYRSLPVAALPSVAFPTILVTTRLPGANADTVSRLITAPLQHEFGDIAGLSAMSSVSSYGTSAITLRFSLQESLTTAAQAVQAAIDAAAATLPPNIPYPPVYSEINPADSPIMVLALTSRTTPLPALASIANTLLTPRLSEVSGVGRVQVQGGMKKAIRVHINPVRLAAYGLSLEDVRTAIADANQNGPKGGFEGRHQAFAVGATDQLQSIRAFRRIVIASVGGTPVTIANVGSVAPGLENPSVVTTYNQVPAVLISIDREPGANIVRTVARVKAALSGLSKILPAATTFSIVANRTTTIKASVADVELTLMTAIVLVVLVIFVFLPTWRAALIPAVALPLSLIGTFAAMHALGFSLDNLSLMALTVASGFVVDDAIVMIENIVRFLEAGARPLTAALDGSRQIGFTIVSLTISLIAVFIPLLFMPGLVGRLFREFSMTLSIAVAVSAVISLTLTPMMCAHLLQPTTAHRSALAAMIDRLWHSLREHYRATLISVLRHRTAVLWAFGATLAGTLALFIVIPKGLLPTQDTSEIAVATRARASISLPAFAALQAQAIARIRRNPAVSGVTSYIGTGLTNPTPNTGELTVLLKPIGTRPALQTVEAALRRALRRVPGLRADLRPVQDITLSSRPSPTTYQYTLTDTDNMALTQFAASLVGALRHDAQLRDVTSSGTATASETYVRLQRTRAATLGVTMQTVANILYDAYGQRQVSTIYTQNDQYRVVLGVAPHFRQSPAALGSLYIPGAGNAEIPLGEIARISTRRAPLAVDQENQIPAVTIGFNLAPHVALQSAERSITRAEHALHEPATITGHYSGAAARFQTSLAREPWLIAATIIVIYIVLGILYESAIHPLTILSTLPSASIGALAALYFTGTEFTIVALVGIVLLMGIVKKNGIMMVDFAIEAQRQGASPEDAIIEASVLRFRPIMMTTLAALLGAVPLVLESGAGAELRIPLGITIIGGLLISQILTLFTTPVIYLTLDRLRRPGILDTAPALNDS
ncbi:efflux RND transporter permease subunit [Acidiferrobacter sp.]|uniref:efflux RND transporter permease subunit n=1 Tax=Acidiferrobacter sp. TaxID=1872107 RepID=UPI0026282973|nr:efflux RND transporter permease subunit [Acidiferrobacter sp.]